VFQRLFSLSRDIYPPIIGAPSLALEHYRAINIKQIQTDTLSHFVLSRAYTFSLAATGDLTYATECLESSNIYVSNSQEVKIFIAYFSLELTTLGEDI
jgi:N-terminal acetyltransferase B complex non-catalytic subunit